MKLLLLLLLLAGSSLIPPLVFAQANCNGQTGANIVSNGDFGSGLSPILQLDPVYAPAYNYQFNTAPAPGQYTITHSSQLPGSNCWINTNDNSNDPNGYFMIINTGENPGIIYQQNLEVCDGIPYLLSVDLVNLNSNECISNSPNIDLLIDGQVIRSLGDLPEDGSWSTFTQQIEITAGTNLITLALRNNTGGNFVNDLGIDNVVLQHCGPELALPATTFVCDDGGILSIAAAEIDYSTPYYQWQQSFDGGNSWFDLPNAHSSSLAIGNPNAGIYYRVMVANGPVNFLSESCRTTSNATRLEVRSPVEVYQTPVICEGDSLQLGNTILTQAGDYTTLIPGESGCDSIVHTLLFTHPAYEQWFSQSLCAGDSFGGQAFYADTTVERILVTHRGCDSIIRYEINVFSATDLTISGETQFCAGDSTQLYTTAAYPQYQWSNGATTPGISVNQSGDYTLTVSNAQGCQSSTSLTITSSQPFMETMSTDPSCFGQQDGSIEVLFQDGGIAPYAYSLDGDSWTSTASFTSLAPGQYTVSIQDALACTGSQTILINEAADWQIELVGLPIVGTEAGDSVQLQALSTTNGLSFQWSGNGIFGCLDCATTSWLPLGAGNLRLEAWNTSGCSQRIDTTVSVLNPLRVYIPNAFSPNGDGFNDTFFPATASNAKIIEIWEIYDRWGGLVFQQTQRLPNDPALAWDGNWHGKPPASGTYLYRAEISFNNGRTKNFTGEVFLKL